MHCVHNPRYLCHRLTDHWSSPLISLGLTVEMRKICCCQVATMKKNPLTFHNWVSTISLQLFPQYFAVPQITYLRHFCSAMLSETFSQSPVFNEQINCWILIFKCHDCMYYFALALQTTTSPIPSWSLLYIPSWQNITHKFLLTYSRRWICISNIWKNKKGTWVKTKACWCSFFSC